MLFKETARLGPVTAEGRRAEAVSGELIPWQVADAMYSGRLLGLARDFSLSWMSLISKAFPPDGIFGTDKLKDHAIDQFASATANSSRGMSVGIGHHMHGQICRVPDGATPLTRTSGQFTYFLDANWRNPPRAEAAMA